MAVTRDLWRLLAPPVSELFRDEALLRLKGVGTVPVRSMPRGQLQQFVDVALPALAHAMHAGIVGGVPFVPRAPEMAEHVDAAISRVVDAQAQMDRH